MSFRGHIRSMSFRRRMVLLAAGAVAAAVVLASVVVYILTRSELRGQIDASLRQKLTPGQPQAIQVRRTRRVQGKASSRTASGVGVNLPGSGTSSLEGPPGPLSGSAVSSGEFSATAPQGVRSAPAGLKPLETSRALFAGSPVGLGGIGGGAGGLDTSVRIVVPAEKLGGAAGYAQLVQANGLVARSDGRGLGLPITPATRAVAAGRRPAFFTDATFAGTHVRVLTERAPLEGAVFQVALPLTEVDSALARLKLILAAVSLGGIALAAALGLLVSRAALVPVRRLTGAAERVARTQDLGHRIPTGEEGELGRLAASFNTMLAALEHSQVAQRQLVSDASHELRTPLTSVRANLDALALDERLPERDRARVIAAARAQLAELTVLVGDLVDLSKTEVDAIEVEDVRLDIAAAGAVARARLHAPDCRFALHAEPCLVSAAPARLDRAIANLLDNAVKWGPPGGPVDVFVRGGRLDVRDRGPGIESEDLPHVFDRFYRARAARGLPGSGLGLAIVRQVAETHGGSVHVANDSGGGARLTLELPTLPMTPEDSGAPSSLEPLPGAPVAPGAVQQAPRLL
jgi:two-component system, OmpR family, sensor histidine kinase MprB